jgi:hypothetical protein
MATPALRWPIENLLIDSGERVFLCLLPDSSTLSLAKPAQPLTTTGLR